MQNKTLQKQNENKTYSIHVQNITINYYDVTNLTLTISLQYFLDKTRNSLGCKTLQNSYTVPTLKKKALMFSKNMDNITLFSDQNKRERAWAPI